MKLSDRMKSYEECYDFKIHTRVPVIVRVDGKGFSKYTKTIKANKPFDESLSQAMTLATNETAAIMEGCVFAYTQSDEASFVLLNDQSEESQPWFGNRLQKIISVAASAFTVNFASKMAGLPRAYFDARVFAVPNKVEAMNYLVWRQQDATRNSIQSSSYYEVGKKVGKKTARQMLEGLDTKKQQELLFSQTGINWDTYATKFKRGIAVYKETFELDVDGNKVQRSRWKIDEEIPIFSSDKDFLKRVLEKKSE